MLKLLNNKVTFLLFLLLIIGNSWANNVLDSSYEKTKLKNPFADFSLNQNNRFYILDSYVADVTKVNDQIQFKLVDNVLDNTINPNNFDELFTLENVKVEGYENPQNLTFYKQSNTYVYKAVVSGAESVFKAGDNITGKTIVQVKQGTNGKVAVIGRQMKDHVNDVAAHLKNNQGLQVEILDDAYLNRTFDIDGVEWTVNSAWDDMVQNPAYNHMRDPMTNHITAEYIEEIPMYKLNKQWVEYIQSEGFTIIDMGYPIGHNLDPSLFYNMEINTINW